MTTETIKQHMMEAFEKELDYRLKDDKIVSLSIRVNINTDKIITTESTINRLADWRVIKGE